MALKVDLSDIEDSVATADWLEMMLFVTSQKQLARARLTKALAAKLSLTTQQLEVAIGQLFAEIDRRRYIAGKGYPFFVDGDFVRVDNTPASELYKFLLFVSLSDAPKRYKKQLKKIDGIFDLVVIEAVKGYLGVGSKAVRFGWPPSDGRPKRFNDALSWLASNVGLSTGSGKPSRNVKDGGVDVVAWKPFADKNPAFVVVLVQSTVRKNWYPKGKDVVPDLWRSYIDTGRTAMTGLAIPFVIPRNYENWSDLKCITNVVFDRLRLIQMLTNCGVQNDKLIRWNEREIRKVSMMVV